MIITTITRAFISMVIPFEPRTQASRNLEILILQLLTFGDVLSHVIIVHLYVTFIFSASIFCVGVVGFATNDTYQPLAARVLVYF